MKHSPTFVRVDSPRELERLTRLANDTISAETRLRAKSAGRTCRRLWMAVAVIAATSLVLHVVENSPMRRHLCGIGLRCELVVCACNESLAWVPRAASGMERVTIYSKCGAEPNLGPHRSAMTAPVRVVSLPNVGRYDHAYLTHVLEEWEELKRELVFSEGELMRVRAWQMLSPGAWNAHSLRVGVRPVDLLPRWMVPCAADNPACKAPQDLRKFSMRHQRPYMLSGGGPVSGGGPTAAPSAVEPASRAAAPLPGKAAHGTRGADNPHSDFVLSGYGSHEEWLRATVGVPLAEWLYAHAEFISHSGYFMVPSAEVYRYPRELYARLRRQQTRRNEEVDHFIERTWGLLFTARGVPPALSSRQVPPG